MAAAAVGRKKHAEERREAILDASVRLFAMKGCDGTAIRDIAREVGVTEGLIYHYFGSKEQLILACWRERSWRAHLERILASAVDRPVDLVLRDIVRDFLQTMRAHGATLAMHATEAQRNPNIAKELCERIAAVMAMLTEFLRVREEAGEIRSGCDHGMAANLLMGGAHGTLMFSLGLDAEEWNAMVERYVRSGVDTLLRGVGASGSAPQPVAVAE